MCPVVLTCTPLLHFKPIIKSGSKFGATDYKTTSPLPNWKREDSECSGIYYFKYKFPRSLTPDGPDLPRQLPHLVSEAAATGPLHQ